MRIFPPRMLDRARVQRWIVDLSGILSAFALVALVPTFAATPADLDLRVAPAVVMGDDPSELPAGQRAQAEPHLARSPLDPDRIVAAFQEGRYAGPGAISCGWAVSTNGGLSWTRSLLPGLTQGQGGAFFRATDPVVAFDAAGRVFINTLGAIDETFDHSAILIHRSTDGGHTFGAPVEIYRWPDASGFADKNWLAINRFPGTSTFGRLIVTFTLFQGGSTPILALHSDDGGDTWSKPVFVTSPNAICQGSIPVFLPNGQLTIVYWNFGSPGEHLEAAISSDGGETFGGPIPIARVTPFNAPGIRDGYFLPAAAADATEGKLWVVYQAQHEGSPRILCARSPDGGSTWLAPVVVSDNPAGVSTFNPAVDVSADGRVVSVLYGDRRSNPDLTTQFDYQVAFSFNGGAVWQPSLRASSVPVDLSTAPQTSSGRMIGDYFGIVGPVGTNTPAVVAVIGTERGGPDPVGIRVAAATAPQFESWAVARLSRRQWLNAADLSREDSDGDGVPLLAEYAFGLDPTVADSAQLAIAPKSVGGIPGQPGVMVRHPWRRGISDLDFVWEAIGAQDTRSVIVPLREEVEVLAGLPNDQLVAEFPAADPSQLLRLRLHRRSTLP